MKWLLAILLVIAVLPTLAEAHDSRPVSMTLSEPAPQNYQIDMVVPGSVPFANLPIPRLPDDCTAISSLGYRQDIAKRVARYTYHCRNSLEGREIGLQFPNYNPSLTTLLRGEFLSGVAFTKALGPNEVSWRLPERETAQGVSLEYFQLGIDHILGGYDHLLFLICVLIIARRPKQILFAVTGFTLAHSATLALAALGFVGVSIPLIESLIALSIVFVAAEIVRGNKTTLTFSYPIVVTAFFGLLHGFGFASALSEVGLPQTQLPLALLMFNLGIEAGQLAVVALVLALTWSAVKFSELPLPKVEYALSCGVGILSSFWFFERMIGALA